MSEQLVRCSGTDCQQAMSYMDGYMSTERDFHFFLDILPECSTLKYSVIALLIIAIFGILLLAWILADR